MSQYHFLEQLETICRDLKRVQQRMVKASGKSAWMCNAYLTLNLVDLKTPILITVGIKEDDTTRWNLDFSEFDWGRLRPEIEAAAAKSCAANRPWSDEDVGRTLGIITDPPAAEAA